MNGFSVGGSSQYEDWQLAEGAALKRELTMILDWMIDYYNAKEAWATSARYARKWIQAEPLNEMGYFGLMTALLAQGFRSEALRIFETCSRTLSAELGLSPGDAMCRLARSIQSNDGKAANLRIKDQEYRLPHTLTPLIGRREIAVQIEGLLEEGTARVVTITGLGGSGKTSLALHVGRRVEKRYEHGAAMVFLDSIRGENSVCSAVAEVLGLSFRHEEGLSQAEQLADFLQTRSLLLILDGAEGVLPQISSLLHVLETAPDVQFLLTSRIALGHPCEASITLQGLKHPNVKVPVEQLSDYPAIRLLCIASQQHGAQLSKDESELASMARLTRLLEGSPLGLEMAAGWRALLTWDEIADRVSADVSFLSSTRQDVAPKHQSFAAVFEETWRMLPPEGQQAFQRLSVFRSRFTIAAAEYVAETTPAHLAALVNRSLLKRTGPNRFKMHELMRQFASGKLGGIEGEADRAHKRHAEYFLRLVGGLIPGPEGSEHRGAIQQISNDLGNVRRALLTAAEAGDSQLLAEGCYALFCFHGMRALLREGAKLFGDASRLYQQNADRDPVVEAFMKIVVGYFDFFVSPDFDAVQAREGMNLLPTSVPVDRLHAVSNALYAAISLGAEPGANRRRLEASAAFFRDAQDKGGEAPVLGIWARLERRHDIKRAEQLGRESLGLYRETGDRDGEGWALYFLGNLAESRGELELARTQYQAAQSVFGAFVDDAFGTMSAILAQAGVEGRLKQAKRSARLAEEALRIGRENGYRFQVGRALLVLARAAREMGDNASARVHLQEAVPQLSRPQWSDLKAACALLLAELALEDTLMDAAQHWLNEASKLLASNTTSQHLTDQLHMLRDRIRREAHQEIPRTTDG